jgi:hypothetical protein
MPKPKCTVMKGSIRYSEAIAKKGNERIQKILRECASKINRVFATLPASGMNASYNVYDNFIVEVGVAVWTKDEIKRAIALQEKE